MSRFAFLAVFATLIVLSGARGADAQQMSISITLPANNQTFGLQANVGVSGACSQKNATVNVQVTDSNKNVIQSGTCTSSATDGSWGLTLVPPGDTWPSGTFFITAYVGSVKSNIVTVKFQ